MTCIVGLEFQDKVLLGGDIQGTGYNNKVVHTQPKVFNKKGVVFGFTSSYRFGQILEHNLADPVVPDNNDDIYRWLITVVIPDIRTVLKMNGYETGGNCLIGVKGQLWEMQNDFSVLRSVNGYGACGSGYEYAMGSLHTVMTTYKPRTQAEAEAAVAGAIKVAGSFSPSVGCDSVIITT
jgi:ATP-dependent protease HslVU (ClpYQ) peptidase subunit